MKTILLSAALLCGLLASAQQDPKTTELWKPEPPVVTPGKTVSDAPSDAVVLFGGAATGWQHADGSAAKWTNDGSALTVAKGAGNIETKQKFGDCQLHIEWRSPAVVKGNGQGRGNSGIFLMGRYEVQVLDSYNNQTYSNGQAGSIYKQHIPLANACKGPGEWQTYDIIFTAPRFSANGTILTPAAVTVIHNGVLVQNHATIWGNTEYIGSPQYKKHEAKESIILQDHGDLVSFRNIWIREL